jgi:hypothetical protein
MTLSEAIKMTLYFRQCPMTAHQIAYFLAFNRMFRTDCLQEMIKQVEAEVYFHPCHFTIADEMVTLSVWREAEQEKVQSVFDKVQAAIKVLKEAKNEIDSCNNMVLALLLYKRLSDIKRSQQLGAPIVPVQWKFNQVTSTSMLSELPARIYEVMDYIERTDDRLANTFLFGKEELSNLSDTEQIAKLREVMRLLSTLNLDEEHMPTPLFQSIFSRLFWNNVKHTSRELCAIA